MLFGDILGGFLFFCGKVASMQGILSHQFGILNAVLTSSRVYKIAKRKHEKSTYDGTLLLYSNVWGGKF